MTVHITHVIDSMDPAAGGPPQVVAALASAQTALGCRVSVIHFTGNWDASRFMQAYREMPGIDSVQWRHVADDLSFWLGSSSVVARRLGILDDNVVLHVHGLWRMAILRVLRVAKSRGVPYVITPHGMLAAWSLRQKAWKKKTALALAWKKALNSAAFLHALNDAEAEEFRSLGLLAPIFVLRNGVFMNGAEADGEFVGQLPSAPYVIFLGRLHYKKGLDILAKAFARVLERFPAARLVIVGPDGGAEESLRQELARLQIDASTHMPGALFGQQKNLVLRQARCFCLPSRQEGFSVAIVEALAEGVPVVISEACNFPEVVAAGAGIVTSLTPESVADGIMTYLKDETARQAAGEAARRMVSDGYQWSTIARDSLAIYEQ